MQLGSLSSDFASAVLTVLAVFAAMLIALAVMVYIHVRRAGRWVRATLNRQLVNLAPGPSRDLVRMRARLDRSRHGAHSAVATATANGEALGDLGLLCARLDAVGERLDAQLELIAAADLSPKMLNAALTPLRARVDAYERVATDLATIAATSIAAVHGVELAAINEEVDEVRQLVERANRRPTRAARSVTMRRKDVENEPARDASPFAGG